MILDDIINLSRYSLTISVDSAIITSSSDVIELAAISRHNKFVHKFNLLPSQDFNSVTSHLFSILFKLICCVLYIAS